MSDPRRLDGERVFCHQCSNEWDRARGGLQCPRCEGEFVEIASTTTPLRGNHANSMQLSGNRQPDTHDLDSTNEPGFPPLSQPRSPSSPFGPQPNPYSYAPPHPPQHPLHNHDPWADVPDPEEGDISTFQFQTPGGGRGTFSFTSRTYTSRDSPFGNRAGGPQLFGFGPASGFGSFEARGGAFGTAHARGPQPGNMQDLFSAIFSSMQQAQMEGGNGQRGTGGIFVGGNATRAPNPFDLLSAILNPGAHTGRAGDMVWSQEAFDRILEQLAEQGNSAPPPASEAAIKALPKKKVEKDMLGEDGKAECSICMDAVELGTEVTNLPCNHWFHEDCVVAWLKEHDTCPHCRKPITTDEERQQGTASGSARRSSRRSSSVASPQGGSGQRPNPWMMPESPSALRDARTRYYGSRTTSDRERIPQPPLRRSTSLARSTEPQQYYGGRHESTEYYSGPPDPPDPPGPPQTPGSQRRPSRSESQRNQNGGNGGGVTGWIRDHLPLGGSR